MKFDKEESNDIIRIKPNEDTENKEANNNEPNNPDNPFNI